MRRVPVLLVLAALACGSDATGPRDANVEGTWIFTLAPTAACSFSQISFILSRSPSGAPIGDHGSYVVDCTNPADDETVPSGTIAGWQVSGNAFSLQITNAPPRRFTGTVNGGTMTGDFTYGVVQGSFSASKQ